MKGKGERECGEMGKGKGGLGGGKLNVVGPLRYIIH